LVKPLNCNFTSGWVVFDTAYWGVNVIEHNN
jgi:hypothetical protein